LIIAGVLAGSAGAAVQVFEHASAAGSAPFINSVRAEQSAANEALFLVRLSATPGGQQRPAGIVRIGR